MYYVFTSINAKYLPNARILAKSLKRWHPEWRVVLLLSDESPGSVIWADEPFDEVFFSNHLPIDGFDRWAFQYSVVELCTAVKGVMAEVLINRAGCKAVVYLDPDTVVFSPMEELLHLLEQREGAVGTVLTPHITDAEDDDAAIVSHEFAALKHGTFNLGFFAFANNNLGLSGLNYWSDRVKRFSFIDFQSGLFTDQKWANLIPYMFDGVRVLTNRGYNTATWNMNGRRITRCNDIYLVNDAPLRFYHFSGFGNDFSWADKELEEFGKSEIALRELWGWYKVQLRENQLAREIPWAWGFFEDREPITARHRRLAREYSHALRDVCNPYSPEMRHRLDVLADNVPKIT